MQHTYSDQRTAGHLGIADASADEPLDNTFSVFTADVDAYAANADDEPEAATLWELGMPVAIPPGETVIIDVRPATNRDSLSGSTRGTRRPSWANSALDGLGSDMTNDVTVSLTPFTKIGRLSLENTNADETVFVTSVTITGVRLQADRRLAGIAAQRGPGCRRRRLASSRRYPSSTTRSRRWIGQRGSWRSMRRCSPS